MSDTGARSATQSSAVELTPVTGVEIEEPRLAKLAQGVKVRQVDDLLKQLFQDRTTRLSSTPPGVTRLHCVVMGSWRRQSNHAHRPFCLLVMVFEATAMEPLAPVVGVYGAFFIRDNPAEEQVMSDADMTRARNELWQALIRLEPKADA